MKTSTLILLIFLLPGAVFGSDDIIYLKCRYADSDKYQHIYPKERIIVMKIDLNNKSLIFEDFYGTGSTKKEYKLEEPTNDKFFAFKIGEAGIVALEIDRISGNWLEKTPIKKEDNKNLWNEKERKVGYPEDVQLTISVGGVCKQSKPAI